MDTWLGELIPCETCHNVIIIYIDSSAALLCLASSSLFSFSESNFCSNTSVWLISQSFNNCITPSTEATWNKISF